MKLQDKTIEHLETKLGAKCDASESESVKECLARIKWPANTAFAGTYGDWKIWYTKFVGNGGYEGTVYKKPVTVIAEADGGNYSIFFYDSDGSDPDIYKCDAHEMSDGNARPIRLVRLNSFLKRLRVDRRYAKMVNEKK